MWRTRLTTLGTAILLTWGSTDPGALVRVERRVLPAKQWTLAAIVPGRHYLDYRVQQQQEYCYRARLNAPGGAAWSPGGVYDAGGPEYRDSDGGPSAT